MNYTCEDCDYHTNLKTNYDRHLGSSKHNKKVNNLSKQYVCVLCGYKCTDQSNFNKHLGSKRHIDNDPIQQKRGLEGLIRTFEKRIQLLNENPTMSYMYRWQKQGQTNEECMNEQVSLLEKTRIKLENLNNHNGDVRKVEYVQLV